MTEAEGSFRSIKGVFFFFGGGDKKQKKEKILAILSFYGILELKNRQIVESKPQLA